MRWGSLRESDNVEDARGFGGRGIAVGGGGIGILILALAVYLCGGDPRALLNNLQGGQDQVQQQQQPGPQNQGEDQNMHFARAVLGSTEDAFRTGGFRTQRCGRQARCRRLEPDAVAR